RPRPLSPPLFPYPTLFRSQELRQFVDLRVQPVQHLVLARNLAPEQELRQNEHRQEEHEGEEQRRERIDEARPIVDPAIRATAAGDRKSTRLNSSHVKISYA